MVMINYTLLSHEVKPLAVEFDCALRTAAQSEVQNEDHNTKRSTEKYLSKREGADSHDNNCDHAANKRS